jgi:hypothetical protein
MKFLFVARNPSLYVQFEHVIKGLIEQGHQLEFHLVSMVWRNAKMDTEILSQYAGRTDGSFSFRPSLVPLGLRAAVLRHKREMVNYAAYLRKDNPLSRSPYMIERQCQALYPPMHILALNRIFKTYVLRKGRIKKLSCLEKCIPPDEKILKRLQEDRPDLVLASPFIFSRSSIETEYIKCANALNIPTCAAIFSWDNLTSKGIFQIIPDTILVWNEKQVVELEQLHGVEKEKGIVTGAPSLDGWFDRKPKQSFKEFCDQHTLSDKKFILYLCSSQTIARDEHVYVKELVTFLQTEMGQCCPTVVIRPHPLNIGIWHDWKMIGTAIIPQSSRDIFYSAEAKDLMYESIFHSSCVIGLNTTAMIETAIIGKPCFSIIVDKYSNTQAMSGHFHHLTESGFMRTCNSMYELTGHITDALQGNDVFREAREAFIASFIRPFGRDVNSSQVMQNVLVKLASGLKNNQVKLLLKTQQDGF